MMEHITDEILRRAVARQPELSVRPRHPDGMFDTHDLIFTIMSHWPNLYAQELQGYADDPKGDAFKKLHPVIAGRLADLRDVAEQQDRKVCSMNCRGEKDECALWRRVG